MMPPYARMLDARAQARRAFPGADAIKSLWTPNGRVEIVVEVWTDGAARVIPCDRLDEACR